MEKRKKKVINTTISENTKELIDKAVKNVGKPINEIIETCLLNRVSLTDIIEKKSLNILNIDNNNTISTSEIDNLKSEINTLKEQYNDLTKIISGFDIDEEKQGIVIENKDEILDDETDIDENNTKSTNFIEIFKDFFQKSKLYNKDAFSTKTLQKYYNKYIQENNIDDNLIFDDIRKFSSFIREHKIFEEDYNFDSKRSMFRKK